LKVKVKVLRNFKDLKENKFRKANEVFEATKERVEGINSTHHGSLVEVIKEDEEKTIPDEIDVEDLTVKQIKELLDQMGIEYNSKLKKDELIELLQGGD